MRNEIEIVLRKQDVELPEIPEQWDYDESVSKVKTFVYKWKNLKNESPEILEELWFAHENLSKVGVKKSDPRWDKSPTLKTWNDYCEDIGSSRRVVNRWLKNYERLQKQEERQLEIEQLSDKYDREDETIKIECGDFRDLSRKINDESIDIIITDPPYPYEFINLWSDLAEIASRILKPSGFLIAYTGKLHLPEVINRMAEYLEYYWLMSYKMTQFPTVHPRRVNVTSRPILVYQKSPIKAQDEYFFDGLDSKKPEKDDHDWQQSNDPFEYIIKKFTKPNDLIYEPFLGSGTTAVCAKKLKRRCIGHEIDGDAFKKTKGRLAEN